MFYLSEFRALSPRGHVPRGVDLHATFTVIDLRPDGGATLDGGGLNACLLYTPTQEVVDSSALLLGLDPTDTVPTLTRSRLTQRLNVTLRGQTVGDIVWQLLTEPPPRGWQPIRAGQWNNRRELYLGALHRSESVVEGAHDASWARRRLMGAQRWADRWRHYGATPWQAFQLTRYGMSPICGGAVLATDNFDRADADTLGSNWTTQTGENMAGIFANAVDTVVSAGGVWYNAVTWPDDQYSKITCVASAAHEQSARVRCSNSAQTYYGAGHDNNNNGNKNRRIWKWVAGAYTSLTSEAVNLGATDVLQLEVQGTSLTFKVNDVTELTTTDTAITTGRAGFGIFHSAFNVALMDNFEGGDFAAGHPALRRARATRGSLFGGGY